MNPLLLAGCHPQPLAAYLKALGIFRLVAEQADPSAQAAWTEAGFTLYSRLTAPEVERFFLDAWRPSPVLAPWNGGSGFYPKDNRSGIDPLRASAHPRFAPYRAAIEITTSVLMALGITEKPEPKVMKPLLIQQLRAEWPDDALEWLDAAIALLGDEPRYPPLLGTGGNDGRLDFTNNQMQRIVELLIEDKKKRAPGLLKGALWGTPVKGLIDASVGQFAPSAAGGANAGPGFFRDPLVNPWDFVLMIEGSLLFAGAISRRIERAEAGALAYPFTVRPTAGGYGSAARGDEAGRGELWLPLWDKPTGIAELKSLFSEGRAMVPSAGRPRPAANGLDFARAIAALGVDRGIAAFERFSIQERNGQANLAIPLGHWRVRRVPPADLLAPLDPWLMSLRIAAADERCPASVQRAWRSLEARIFALCAGQGGVEGVLTELAAVEDALARSTRFTKDKGLRPVPALDAAWVEPIADGSPAFRLALGLAAVGLRERRSPVRWERGRPQWMENNDGKTVWTTSSLERNLQAWLLRQEVEGEVAPRLAAGASAADLAAWIEGRLDDDRVERLAAGLALIPPERLPLARFTEPKGREIPTLYALLAVARQPHTPGGQPIPRTPGLLRRAIAGDAEAASTLALRRLHGAGYRLACTTPLRAPPARCSRIAAALIWPLAPSTLTLFHNLLSSEDDHAPRP